MLTRSGEAETPLFSHSEAAGLRLLTPQDLLVYSVGISTGGTAEISMARAGANRKVVATTVDPKGLQFAREQIQKEGLDSQIQVKLEDVSRPLSYPDDSFDFIYARLVLHYLSKQQLDEATRELRRILKPRRDFFVVVRSTSCPDAKDQKAVFDPLTCLTTLRGEEREYSRYFHTQESISTALKGAGFNILSVAQYDEQLFKDFARTQIAPHLDNVIEVIAQK